MMVHVLRKRINQVNHCWAEARIKIARMILTIKLDGNWSSFQLANSAPPLSVTDSAIAPSARMLLFGFAGCLFQNFCLTGAKGTAMSLVSQSHVKR